MCVCVCFLSGELHSGGQHQDVHGAIECDVNAQCCPGLEAMHCIVKGHACVCICLSSKVFSYILAKMSSLQSKGS